MGEDNVCCMSTEKVSIKDYVSENSAIINDLAITINIINVFIQGDNSNEEKVKEPNPNCLIEEIKNQNNNLKTILEKTQMILNKLK